MNIFDKISIMFVFLILLIISISCNNNKSQNYKPRNSNSQIQHSKTDTVKTTAVAGIKITGSPYLKISLEKKIFSEYEPITILVKYINGTNIQDSLYEINSYSYERKNFIIKDKEGNLLKKKPEHWGCGIEKLKYSVNPSDTFNFISYVAGYGEYIKDTNLTFDNSTYLPKGTYSLRIKLDKGYAKDFSPELISNEVKFEVKNFNAADIAKVNLINNCYRITITKTNDEVRVHPVYDFTNIDTININEHFSSYIYYLYFQQLRNEYWNKKINYDIFMERVLFNAKRSRNSIYNIKVVEGLLYILRENQVPSEKINEVFNKSEFEGSLFLNFANNKYLKSKFNY